MGKSWTERLNLDDGKEWEIIEFEYRLSLVKPVVLMSPFNNDELYIFNSNGKYLLEITGEDQKEIKCTKTDTFREVNGGVY